MIKKYFIVSDVHSYYDIMIDALAKAGYEKDNPDHYLVFNGDIFDRGDGTLELYDMVRTNRANNIILIRGNHERLLVKCINRGMFFSHDWSNGTAKTICSIALNKKFNNNHEIYADHVDEFACCEILKEQQVDNWIESDEWVDYLEIGPYIITHSFIPLDVIGFHSLFDCFYYSANLYGGGPTDAFEFKDDWRDTATAKHWDACNWGNPHNLYKAGWFAHEEEKGKYLISGHWGTFEYWNDYDKHGPYQDGHFVGIDATTALSKQINVAIITENTDTNEYSLELK
jgi:predicted phosphodiesterase